MGIFGDNLSISSFSGLLDEEASIDDTAFPILEQNVSSVDYSSNSSSSDFSSYSEDSGSDSDSSSGSDSGSDSS